MLPAQGWSGTARWTGCRSATPTATAERFLRYVDALAPVLAAGVERVETINEPNIFASLKVLRASGSGDIAQGASGARRRHDAGHDRRAPRHPRSLVAWVFDRNALVTPPPGFGQIARTVTEQRVPIPTPDAPTACHEYQFNFAIPQARTAFGQTLAFLATTTGG